MIRTASLLLLILSFFAITPEAYAVSRVSAGPALATMQENGATQLFTITLDEPIVSSDLNPGYVTINLTVDDTRLGLSTTSLTFLSATWSEAQSFLVTTADDEVHNTDNTANISLLAVSNSEYYSNFRNSIAISLIDDDSVRTSSRSSRIRYGCKDKAALNYEYFSASKPSLCKYAATLPDTSTQRPFDRDLEFGTTGDDVKELQVFLIKEDIGPASKALAEHGPTGYFGNLTKAAVTEFQKAKGILPASGYFGPKSRAVVGK